MASDLQLANDIWVNNGKPEQFDPSTTLKSSSETLFIFTNKVEASGSFYNCRFAIRSLRIKDKGIMAIADDRVILWIQESDGKVILSPEKNGIVK